MQECFNLNLPVFTSVCLSAYFQTSQIFSVGIKHTLFGKKKDFNKNVLKNFIDADD